MTHLTHPIANQQRLADPAVTNQTRIHLSSTQYKVGGIWTKNCLTNRIFGEAQINAKPLKARLLSTGVFFGLTALAIIACGAIWPIFTGPITYYGIITGGISFSLIFTSLAIHCSGTKPVNSTYSSPIILNTTSTTPSQPSVSETPLESVPSDNRLPFVNQQPSSQISHKAVESFKTRSNDDLLLATSRNEHEQQTNASTKIQSLCRTYLAQQSLKEKRDIEASKIIQAVFRKHIAKLQICKKQRCLLSNALLEKSIEYIKQPEKLEELTRPGEGASRVFLGPSFVIKYERFDSDIYKRFKSIIEAHDLCEQNGYKHITVPRARYFSTDKERCVIEERLPIPKQGDKERMGFYIDNHEKFTQAAREFTHFLCFANLPDIFGMCRISVYETLSGGIMGRHDNVKIYLENGVGKVGLVDLDGFSKKIKIRNRFSLGREGDDEYFACYKALLFFPLHFEEILSVAEKYYPDLRKECLSSLKEHRAKILKTYEAAYFNHLEFLTKKGISIKNPLTVPKIDPQRSGQIFKTISAKLLEKNKEDFCLFAGFLGKEPLKMLNTIERNFLQILQFSIEFLRETVEENLKKYDKPLQNHQLLLARTTEEFINKKYERRILEFLGLDSNIIDEEIYSKQEGYIPYLLFSYIFGQLANDGEIHYSNAELQVAEGRSPLLFF